MLVAVGGQSGFVHIFAVYNKNKSTALLGRPQLSRVRESKFYEASLSVEDFNFNAIVFNEEINETIPVEEVEEWEGSDTGEGSGTEEVALHRRKRKHEASDSEDLGRKR